MSAQKKKSFVDENNPALAFITATPTEPETLNEPDKTEIEQAPEEQEPARQPRRNRQRPETKSRRLQLLIKPSMHDALKDIAEREGISVNEAVNEAIEDYIKSYGEEV